MQPYSYIAYPNPNRATMPVPYKPPANNYRQSSTVRPTQYAPKPFRYPPGHPGRVLPRPPVSTMLPVMPPQFQQFQYPQTYYYNPNEANPAVPSNSKPSAAEPKKDAKEYKDNVPHGAQNQGIKGLLSNNNINDLLKHKGTKLKVSKIYRITKMKPDSNSSDDEYEQVPLDSPRPRTQKQSSVPTKRSTAQIQRIPSVASSCSHCSTCTNCSCSECLYRNGRYVYDDCSECRAERKRQQIHTTRQKRK